MNFQLFFNIFKKFLLGKIFDKCKFYDEIRALFKIDIIIRNVDYTS